MINTRRKTFEAIAWLACSLAIVVGNAEESGFHRGDWPFVPLSSPQVPEVKASDWGINEIDDFILAELEKRGLEPNEMADKATLLRRATFDLTGLPPSLAELNAFLLDESPEAYERAIDRLLASPRYGERWGRHWLDLVRYADTAGFKTDYLRTDAYRYRDYVIRALNDDLSYDRFLQQQLAGDELEPANPDAIIATGMLRLYAEESTASDFSKQRQDVLDDITEVSGLAFMGLTVGCAKCHDHKYDPIEQADFYKLEACFATIVPRDDVAPVTPEQRDVYHRQLKEWEHATSEIRRQIDESVRPIRDGVIQEITLAYDSATREAWLTPQDGRSTKQQMLVRFSNRYIQNVIDRRVARMDGEAKAKYDELQLQLAQHDSIKPQPLPTSMSVANGPAPSPTYVLATGDYHKPEQQVSAGFPAFLGPDDVPLPANESRCGHRTALAQWLTRPDHPLTARVMVNRLWQHHFGQGIIASANDFGAMGEPASHPELLDWLASKLVEQDWSLKAIHRLMVTSATYRQRSLIDPDEADDAKSLQVDPENKLLWHARRSRLEGEAYRDAIYFLSGQLQETPYGTASYSRLPQSLIDGSSTAWQPDDVVANQYRRSVFMFQKRNLRQPLLAMLDQPDMYMSCAVRPSTLTSTQSLALFNGEDTSDAACHWAGKLLSEKLDDDEFIARAWLGAFSRRPMDDELNSSRQFLHDQAQRVQAYDQPSNDGTLSSLMPNWLEPHRAAAYVDLCHALLNASEFLWID